ncbi:hypothetical protein EWM64_g2630 [Hericium alpestre]|uniref:Uncharacterized protein n=1 Tax=Hericium alpestre TaxID=135208 RepID=A0A4Z0A6V1_9AGAM|nr:hypothetical protein EWM64_g2630 [Hericium alpestre]
MLSTCGSMLLRMLPNLRLPIGLIHQANELIHSTVAENLRWLHLSASGHSPACQTELQGWYRLDQPSILDLSSSTGVQEKANVQVAEGEPPADMPMDVDADKIEWSGSTSPPPLFALNAEQVFIVVFLTLGRDAHAFILPACHTKLIPLYQE